MIGLTICPYCKGTDKRLAAPKKITIDTVDIDVNCENCGRTWVIVYNADSFIAKNVTETTTKFKE